MMYKRFIVSIIFVMISLSFIIEPIYAEEKVVNQNQDILFVYDKVLSKDGEKNIDSIIKILIYLGYNVSFRSIDNAIGGLKNYSHIIIYSEKDTLNKAFIKELGECDNKFMIIGSGAVKEIIETLRMPVTCENIEDYNVNVKYKLSEQKEINTSVGIQNIALIKGKFDYANGNIDVKNINGYYCIRIDNFTSIAMYSYNSNLLKSMLAKEIRLWMQYNTDLLDKYEQYIVFHEIYPFMNPNKMLEIIEIMKEYKLPYIISVMPIYDNVDYPDMKKFCEILTYAQANGGAVVLHYPIIQTDTMNKEEIEAKIKEAFYAYSKYGVYPIGFEAPDNWIYDQTGTEIMKEFKTVILTQTESGESTIKENTSQISFNGQKVIGAALDIGNNSFKYIQAYPTAIYLDSNKDIKELQEQVKLIKQSDIKINSMWEFEQAININEEILKYKSNVLEVHGKEVSLKYTPFEYEEKFNYNRGIISNLVEAMNKSNQVLLTIVIITTIIFISFIIMARYRNYKKFFFDDNSKSK